MILRESQSYGIYDTLNFKISKNLHSDCYDKYPLTMLKTKEYLKPIKQRVNYIQFGKM